MFILSLVVSLGWLITLAVFLLKNKALAQEIIDSKTLVARTKSETEKALSDVQSLVDKEIEGMKAESDRIRQHYELEAQKLISDYQAQNAQAAKDVEGLKRYRHILDTESEASRILTEARSEAKVLYSEANTLIENSRRFADAEQVKAREKAKLIYEQADARLNQATRDAGRIVADAENRAKEIAGEAYDALRDKQLLERAAQAARNTVEGYGDRYLKPTHSLLDDLAVEFGYTSAGEALKSARTQSRRMIEQFEAATCDYVETVRKNNAIHFVIDAFNGKVDAILTRIKHDNLGTLEQEIRDAFSMVNLNGRAFRDARILPAYLDARLAELKWAVIVQELARKQQEEQRELKARLRDEEKARREQEEQTRQAEVEEEIKRKALEEKEQQLAEAKNEFARAAAEDKATWEQKIIEMQSANEGLRQDLAAATEKKLTIAQQTKRGHVYIISNVGTFGEGIYKIGQTRRLNKQDRIDELGDASVPFDFDIHGWIESDNAPELEHRIQKRFLATQLNKVNSRKEFFRVSLEDIRAELDRLSKEERFSITHWTDMAEAAQYRESRDIENDPEKLGKWLKRQEALADREIRWAEMRVSSAELSEPTPDNYGT